MVSESIYNESFSARKICNESKDLATEYLITENTLLTGVWIESQYVPSQPFLLFTCVSWVPYAYANNIAGFASPVGRPLCFELHCTPL